LFDYDFGKCKIGKIHMKYLGVVCVGIGFVAILLDEFAEEFVGFFR
jgi:hypothetical protein